MIFWRRDRLDGDLDLEVGFVRRVLGWVLAPLAWLMRIPGGVVDCGVSAARAVGEPLFRETRRVRDLVFGVPAVIALVAVVAVTAAAQMRQSGAARAYWAAGAERLRNGDPAGAQLLLQKAISVKHDQRRHREMLMTLALAYEESGDRQRADALMANLATLNAAGHPAAHRYMAVRMAERSLTIPEAEATEPARLEKWRWHLSHAEGSESIDLQRAWGIYCLLSGDPARAAEHLRIAAEAEPALWLQVAEIEAGMEHSEQARETLATARETLEEQFAADPENDRNRMLYASSLLRLDQLAAAERLLKDGLAREDSPLFRRMLAVVYVRKYDLRRKSAGAGDGAEDVAADAGDRSATGEAPEAEGEAFGYLRMALRYDPGCAPALERLLAMARSSAGTLEESREVMRRLVAAGDSSAIALFTLGTLDWLAGDAEQAERHMQQAIVLDGSLPAVANNLAFMICANASGEGEADDLETALALACQAVEAEPTSAAFLDTRGRIHERLGDRAAAIADYQRALEHSPRPSLLQKKLAELYEAMGDTALAAQYRRLSQSPLQAGAE